MGKAFAHSIGKWVDGDKERDSDALWERALNKIKSHLSRIFEAILMHGISFCRYSDVRIFDEPIV